MGGPYLSMARPELSSPAWPLGGLSRRRWRGKGLRAQRRLAPRKPTMGLAERSPAPTPLAGPGTREPRSWSVWLGH